MCTLRKSSLLVNHQLLLSSSYIFFSFLSVKLKSILVISAGECYVQVLQDSNIYLLESTQSTVTQHISTLHQKRSISIYESIIDKDFYLSFKSSKEVDAFVTYRHVHNIFGFFKFLTYTQGTQVLQLHKQCLTFSK